MAKIATSKNSTKKEVIIQKAALLFKTKSYTASSMRELAESMGVEAPSLYNHIGSKSELLQAICFKMGDHFSAQMRAIENSTATIVNKIEAVIRCHLQIMLENFNEVFVANHEWKHLEEPWLGDFLITRRSYEKSLAGLIETGIAKKELKNINPDVAVLTILSAVRGIEFWHQNKKKISQQVLADNMVNHLLFGITL